MLGGGIEFGETAEQTLIREVREEIGAEIKLGRRLGAFENIFEFEGKKGHEIVLMFWAEFADKSFYDMEQIPVIEDRDKGAHASWIELAEPAFYGAID
jgi:ADP-ribose pyrophosphatase YjhB (NUDIX family)